VIEYNIATTVEELIQGLISIDFKDKQFRSSTFMRLNLLNKLLENMQIDANLKWIR